MGTIVIYVEQYGQGSHTTKLVRETCRSEAGEARWLKLSRWLAGHD